MILPIATVRKSLRKSSDDEDSLILIDMKAAEDHIRNFIDGEIPGTEDDSSTEIPGPIQKAFLMLCNDFFDQRNAQTEDVVLNENPAVKALLWPYRQNIGV